MRSSVRLARLGFVQVAAIVLCLGLASPQPSQVSINVRGPRPLAEAAVELERQLGATVTYEDPPYEYAEDIEDVTATVRKDGDLSKRVFVPRSGPLVFGYAIPAGAGADVREAAVRALTDTYNTASDGARFQVVALQPYLHIVPTMSRNAAGVLEGRRSLLDVTVSMPAQEKTLMEAVTDLLQRLTESNGVQVGIGSVPINLMLQTKTSTHADNENARAILQRFLGASDRQLSWHLTRGPGPSALCVLNIYITPRPRQ